MAGDRQPVKVRALDECAQFGRRDALRLEAPGAELRPLVYFGVDLLRTNVAIPPGPSGAEVRTGVEQPRSGLDAVLDPDAQIAHDVRIHLARRKRRRDAVGQKQRRVGGGFVLAAGAEQLYRVVRVEVEQPRNHRLAIRQRDTLGVRRRDRYVTADAQELSRNRTVIGDVSLDNTASGLRCRTTRGHFAGAIAPSLD